MFLSLSSIGIVSMAGGLLNAASLAVAPSAGCGADGHVPCLLFSALHWLYALAIMLAIGLVVVGAIAWQAYQRNQQNDPLVRNELKGRRR